MHNKLRLFLFPALLLSGVGLNAQNLELGAFGGGAGYLGDLNQEHPLKLSGMSAGGYVKVNFDPYWAAGLHYTYGKIKANDAHSVHAQFRDRNLNFSTALNEVSLQVDFNFLSYFAGGGSKHFTPYIFAGVGAVFFNPKAVYPDAEGKDQRYNLRFYNTEGQQDPYKNYAFSIPYGAGMKFRSKDNWGLFTQVGYRTALSDYLDDVSGYYPSPNRWPANDAPELRAIREQLSNPSKTLGYEVSGTQRGDFRKRDTYMFVGIGISYTFVSQKCYTF